VRVAPIFVFAALVALATPASADEDRLRLTWTAPPGCPSTEEVRGATLRDAESRGAMGLLEADAQVEQKPQQTGDAGWRVRLRTRRGETTGEREIEASSCSGVAEATAVVLALAMVPPDVDEERPPVESVPASEAPRQSDVAVARKEAAQDAHALALGASVATDASTLPSAAIGGSLTAAWTPGRLRVELDARRWVSQSRSLASSASGATFTLTSLGGRGCWAALRGKSVDLAPCAGADLHLVSAPGYGADSNYSPDGSWVSITGGGLGRLSLSSWLALRVRLEAVVPLARPTFVVRNEGSVHRPPSLGAAASVGLELLFL
jgi:hypothetical protein